MPLLFEGTERGEHSRISPLLKSVSARAVVPVTERLQSGRVEGSNG
jgi:hypothetical protein